MHAYHLKNSWLIEHESDETERNINWITSKWLNEFVQDLKTESKIKIANIKSPEEKPLSLYTTRQVTAR